jgi:iron complex transport system substrate-binding protein
VLASADAGPPAVMEQLRAAGLAVATAPDGTGSYSVVPKVRFVGDALGLASEAAALATRIEGDMARVEAAVAGLSETPSAVFLISVGRGRRWLRARAPRPTR